MKTMDKDINYYYDMFQKSIAEVIHKENNAKEKEKAAKYFTQVFELLKLFLITKKERYYGYFLLGLDMVTDYNMNFCAAVSIDENPFRMIFNPLKISMYSIKEILFIICHEIEHLVLSHPAEGVRQNPEKDPAKAHALNVAMDASVNDRIIMEITQFGMDFLKDPGDGITSGFLEKIAGRSYQAMREYTYYFYNFPMKYAGTIEEDEFFDSHVYTNNDSAEDIEASMRLYASAVVEGMSDEDLAKLPEHQREQLERLLAPPKIKWQNILRKYVGTIPDGYRKTKSRLNRRQPERYDISGRVRKRTAKLLVAIDTSGSMTHEIIENIFIEIFAILKHVNYEVTIIECDDEIQNIYTARTMKDINFRIYGRGNTSYLPVIQYINKEGRFKDHVLIYFTDGMGNGRIPRPKTYRNLWVITGGGELSVREPYGEVIEME